ncbi:hypothetical protein COLO4_12498 [Corchorus olitorius]|uniref:Bifunctional inhibitor/plant lipid transfer protein/seed storage helical domain-containing protein n=1 Tax=Corchorus olitorius TaxID=93759 RepID=A0A1R3K0R4_9ROSI|nr:hypothetical protein COLO4_12498 [Corchorus olitorius]
MGSKAAASATTALVCLNLVFFTLVSSTSVIPSIPEPTTPNTPTTEPATITPSCPKDALELEACGNTLKSWLNGVPVPGTPPTPCCSLLQGLVDLDAAACVCSCIKTSVLGINMIKFPYIISTLMKHCGKGVPSGYQCT